jgi:hypothetical protein
VWPEIVANKLNLELINRGMGAFSNDKIIDTIIEDYNLVDCKIMWAILNRLRDMSKS